MITRYFIDLANPHGRGEQGSGMRRVHYRKVGQGPPLLMIHQSPRSSAEYVELMSRWSEHFTCIAPDTPGFGLSDPLPSEPMLPDIDSFADAIIAFLDGLGIEQCAAYGFHSGGIMLVTAAKRYPHRFATLAVGGYAVWTAEERTLFSEKYLPAFQPAAYGEHLLWLWNRIVEQSWFFPWFATDSEHRLSLAHANPALIDGIVRDMLDSGDFYRVGYGAVLNAPRDIPDHKAASPPCLISAYDGDPLQAHIDRLGELPSNWKAQKVASPADHHALSLAHLRETPTPLADSFAECFDEGFVEITTAQFSGLIHWRVACMVQSRPYCLYLHPPGYDMHRARAESSADQAAIYIDMPGHGLSDDWDSADDKHSSAPSDWAAWQAVIEAVAEKLPNIRDIRYPDLPIGDVDRLYPDLSPDRFGNYLTNGWQIVRARHLFAPWYESDSTHAIDFDSTALAPASLARDHRALLNARAAKAYHRALQQRQRERASS